MKDIKTEIKSHFKIVIEYRIDGKRKRHFVSQENLHKYIGIINANKAFFRVITSKADNVRVRLRSGFILDFYSK